MASDQKSITSDLPFGQVASDYKKQYAAIIIAAVILVLSLVWRDILLSLQDIIFPSKNNFFGDLLFATILTAAGVLILVILRRNFDLKTGL